MLKPLKVLFAKKNNTIIMLVGGVLIADCQWLFELQASDKFVSLRLRCYARKLLMVCTTFLQQKLPSFITKR